MTRMLGESMILMAFLLVGCTNDGPVREDDSQPPPTKSGEPCATAEAADQDATADELSLAANSPLTSVAANPSFEEPGSEGEVGVPRAWDSMVLGTAPYVGQDRGTAKDGTFSVKMSADQPSLAALQQLVDVEPSVPYLLRAWVKTKNLEPMEGADMFGTVMTIPFGEPNPDQSVRGPNHEGTTDWTPIELRFVGPDSGQILVFCSLCGQGTARGVVWFDAIEIIPDPSPPSPAPVVPSTAPVVPSTAPAAE